MPSELESIADRLRRVAARIADQERTILRTCRRARDAAAAVAAAARADPRPRPGAPSAAQVAARFEAVARHQDLTIARLGAARSLLETLASTLVTSSGAGPEQRPPPTEELSDPYRQLGALGSRFQPGVHVEHPERDLLRAHERETAELLGGEGLDVRLATEDHTVQHQKNIDAIVRQSPEDAGRRTELKAQITSAAASSVKYNILTAGKQLASQGGGDVVIDGRVAGVTRETGELAIRRAVGQARQHCQAMPSRIRIILGSGESLYWPEGKW